MDKLDNVLLRHPDVGKATLVEQVLDDFLEVWEALQLEMKRVRAEFIQNQVQRVKAEARTQPEKRKAG